MDDGRGGLGPDERRRFGVPMPDVGRNVIAELPLTQEVCGAKRLLGENSEESLDLVEPLVGV